MKKNKEIIKEPIQPDLKHDTMEFAASADGDDIVDMDDEDDEITATELNALEDDGPSAEAYALDAVAIDSVIDEDNFLALPDDIDELEDDDIDDEDTEHRR
jgi:hypothetical protein